MPKTTTPHRTKAPMTPLRRRPSTRPTLRRDRHRRRPQRPRQRRLPREGRPPDADPRAAQRRRRGGDHRGAPAGLLVHDLLVRPQPPPAGHHPRPRADEARLHAAADALDVRADGERRLSPPRPGPGREHPRDRPPLEARRRRLRRVRARHHQGPPGHQAAPRRGPARHLQQRPRGASSPWPGSAGASATSSRRCSTMPSGC